MRIRGCDVYEQMKMHGYILSFALKLCSHLHARTCNHARACKNVCHALVMLPVYACVFLLRSCYLNRPPERCETTTDRIVQGVPNIIVTYNDDQVNFVMRVRMCVCVLVCVMLLHSCVSKAFHLSFILVLYSIFVVPLHFLIQKPNKRNENPPRIRARAGLPRVPDHVCEGLQQAALPEPRRGKPVVPIVNAGEEK